MILPDDVICVKCKKVFCCSICREKHEIKMHGGITKVLEIQNKSFDAHCPICIGVPLTLHSDIKDNLFKHITKNHLPLNCKKCSKTYIKLDDLMEFSKCFNQNVACQRDYECIKSVQSSKIGVTISTQTSPCVKDLNFNDTNNNNTPITVINPRCEKKNQIGDVFVSDSVSSIKNISSINNSSIMLKKTAPVTTTGKVEIARTTSTPLFGKQFAHQGFNAIGGDHVSSIYNSINEQSDVTPPPVTTADISPSCANIDKGSRYHPKVRARGKMSFAVTPLRHVMSKSIQKAIVEHGMAVNGRFSNRKKIFNYNDSCESIIAAPLDLRLSPALRRTKSEDLATSKMEILETKPESKSKRIIVSSKQTTESIMITSMETSTFPKNSFDNDSDSGKSVYKSCQSLEIITETKFNQIKLKSEEVNGIEQIVDKIPHITPKVVGVPINKKCINFDSTPIVTPRQTEDETFYTPNSSPVKQINYFNSSSQDELSQKLVEKFCDCNEIFETELIDENSEKPKTDEKASKNNRNFWSLVTAVIRFPSLSKNTSKNIPFEEEMTIKGSLIKRCASFAGSIVNPIGDKNEFDHIEMNSFKRKRTNTDIPSQNLSAVDSCAEANDISTSSKRFRIHGRKPIDRMRTQNS